MSAELLETDDMFSVGETPWHRLGKVLDKAPTSEDAIVCAGLDWSVEKRPIYVLDNESQAGISDSLIAVEDNFAIVRTKDQRPLGVVGSQYTPLQNTDAFSFFDPMVKQGVATYETAGSLRNGQRVWILARVGRCEIVKKDVVEQYLLLTHTHDGTSAILVKPTGVRVVCMNTMRAALAQATHQVSIRHTATAKKRLDDLGKLMAFSNETFEKSVEAWKHLAKVKAARKDVIAYFKELVPDNENAANNARTQNIRAQLLAGVESSPGSELAAGTWWPVYNSLTYYVTHRRSENQAVDKRLESMWFGAGDTLEKKGLDLALQMAAA